MTAKKREDKRRRERLRNVSGVFWGKEEAGPSMNADTEERRTQGEGEVSGGGAMARGATVTQ